MRPSADPCPEEQMERLIGVMQAIACDTAAMRKLLENLAYDLKRAGIIETHQEYPK